MIPYIIRIFLVKTTLDFFRHELSCVSQKHIYSGREKGELEQPCLFTVFVDGCSVGPGPRIFAWNQREKRGKEHIKSQFSSSYLCVGGAAWWEEKEIACSLKMHITKSSPFVPNACNIKDCIFSETQCFGCAP